jgi:hypothetical protein
MVQYEEDLIHTICGILEVWYAYWLVTRINPLTYFNGCERSVFMTEMSLTDKTVYLVSHSYITDIFR